MCQNIRRCLCSWETCVSHTIFVLYLISNLFIRFYAFPAAISLSQFLFLFEFPCMQRKAFYWSIFESYDFYDIISIMSGSFSSPYLYSTMRLWNEREKEQRKKKHLHFLRYGFCLDRLFPFVPFFPSSYLQFLSSNEILIYLENFKWNFFSIQHSKLLSSTSEVEMNDNTLENISV